MSTVAATSNHSLQLEGIISRALEVAKFDVSRSGASAALPLTRTSTFSSSLSSAISTMSNKRTSFNTKSVPHKAGKSVEKDSKAKRTWKKPKDKPKRPLSAYNIFFKEERANLVAEIDEKKKPEGPSSSNKKYRPRSHRKTHGMGFKGLAQNIAAKWKSLDSKSRRPFDAKAAKDKARYRREVEVWKAAQKVKAAAVQQQEQALRDQQEQDETDAIDSAMDDSTSSAAAAAEEVQSQQHHQPIALPAVPIQATPSFHTNLMFNYPTSQLFNYPTSQLYTKMNLDSLRTMRPPTACIGEIRMPQQQQQQQPLYQSTMIKDIMEPTSIESMMMSNSNSSNKINANAAASTLDCQWEWDDLEHVLDEALEVSVSEADVFPPVPTVGGTSNKSEPSSLDMQNLDDSLDNDLHVFLMNF